MDEPIQPIVLAGGKSRRFGRDKLREPVGEGWLIDRPIAALREVFGPRVAVVGVCDPEVAARADAVIEDRYPGVGPIGGIVSALEASARAVFVLAGDLPAAAPVDVRAIRDAARGRPDAWAVLAGRGEPEPCFGIYRPPSLAPLRRALAEERHALREALPRDQVVLVDLPPASLTNANTPDDLRRACERD